MMTNDGNSNKNNHNNCLQAWLSKTSNRGASQQLSASPATRLTWMWRLPVVGAER